MLRFSSLILLILLGTNMLCAQKAPDSLAVTKLYGTSWILQEHYKSNKRNKLHKTDSVSTERITFYNNEIHWDIAGTPYQVCAHRLRNQNEFWIDCKITDQIIYRVVKTDGAELTIDILIKPFGSTEFKRTARKVYSRAR